LPTSAPYASEDIKEFLKRDVLLYSALWSTSFTTTHIDPWAIMLNNTAIRAKIATFHGFQADLMVRIDINGTPSHYGRLLVAYEPYLPNAGAFDLGTAIDIGPCVQLPHTEIDPTTNETSYMRIPYVNSSDWIDLTSTTGAQLGVLWLKELNALQMMSAATATDVRVRIYGHFENVRLMGATEAATATFVAQSKDEYSTAGVVSKPLSAVSNAAGMLVDVPFIGGFARATQVGAGIASKIANLFGYSRPTNLDPLQRMRMAVFDSFAPLVGYDYSAKLSADPKKELVVSSDAVGMANAPDDLAYSTITRKWGYLGSVTWATTATPTTSLATYGVTPINSPASVVTSLGISPTPLALASMFNTFWSGSIEIRLDIVASAFHKGRLRFIYDCQGIPSSPTVTNVLISDVVDISEVRSVCYTIPWSQACAWCKVAPGSPGWNATTWLTTTHTDGFTNGCIRVYPDNELSSTLSTQGAYINFYIRAGEDFQLAAPNVDGITYFQQQSGPPLCVSLGNSGVVPTDKRGEYMGEDNQSLRSLLKRPSRWRRIGVVQDPISSLRVMRLPHIPANYSEDLTLNLYPPDYDMTPIDECFVRNTPTGFLSQCFLGHRGNQRWKILFDNPNDIAYVDAYFINLDISQPADSTPLIINDTSLIDAGAMTMTSQIAASILTSSGDVRFENGFARFHPALGDAAEFEVPDYNTVRFHVGTRAYSTYPRKDVLCSGAFSYKAKTSQAAGTLISYATLMHSVGEDFNFFFFKYARTLMPMTRAQTASTTRYSPNTGL